MTYYNCPVCGYDQLTNPPANFNVCPCCGTEFEADDFDRSHKEVRGEWIEKDMPWFSRSTLQPKNWSGYRQLLIANHGNDLVAHPRFKSDVNFRYAVNKAFSEVRIGKQLKASREQSAEPLTQLKVAAMAGMKQSRISELEGMNYSSWSISTLERLAKALGVGFTYSFVRWNEVAADIAKGLGSDILGITPFDEEPAFSPASSVFVGSLRNTGLVTSNVLGQYIASAEVGQQAYLLQLGIKNPPPLIDYQLASTKRDDQLMLAAALTADVEKAA
jgi:transcriptional regulator with XRE-family HTH domain